MSRGTLAPMAMAALAVQLAGCSPPVAVAGLALDLIGAATGGGGGGAAFTNPYDQPRGESIADALSGLKDEPDPRCMNQLERARTASDAESGDDRPPQTTDNGPGIRLVCLPGSPTPTAMLLSPRPFVSAPVSPPTDSQKSER